MSEEEIIYRHLDDVPRVVPDYDKLLREDYAIFNERHFGGCLPRLSATFVCLYQKLPGDDAGAYICPERARKMSSGGTGVTPGIRINSKLMEFTPHVRIVLLYEMIHASGILGHGEDFQSIISRLVKLGVYEGFL